jgi:hypothetical protein
VTSYERKRAWRLANPEKAKASVDKFYAANPNAREEKHLKAKYGMTIADRDAMLASQGGVCAICGTDNPGRMSRSGKPGGWIVEHCHATMKVRGIVCHGCNVMLGMSKDKPELLRAAAAYLENV